MYTEQEIKDSYYDLTRNEPRRQAVPERDGGFDSYFERMFAGIDDLTREPEVPVDKLVETKTATFMKTGAAVPAKEIA